MTPALTSPDAPKSNSQRKATAKAHSYQCDAKPEENVTSQESFHSSHAPQWKVSHTRPHANWNENVTVFRRGVKEYHCPIADSLLAQIQKEAIEDYMKIFEKKLVEEIMAGRK